MSEQSYEVANRVAANPLSLPVVSALDLSAGRSSYKTYHRLRIATSGFDPPELSHNWWLWIGVADQIWPVSQFDINIWAKGGLVFAKERAGRYMDRGTAAALALVTGRPDWEEFEFALNNADKFFIFAVNPQGTKRTRIWHGDNDRWDYSDRQPNGAPKKLRRARVGQFVGDDPPAPEWVLFPEVQTEEEENMSVSASKLKQVVISLEGDASDNLSKGLPISTGPVTVTMVEVRVIRDPAISAEDQRVQVVLNAEGVEIAEFWTEPGRDFYAVPIYPGVEIGAKDLVRVTARFNGDVNLRAKFRGYANG